VIQVIGQDWAKTTLQGRRLERWYDEIAARIRPDRPTLVVTALEWEADVCEALRQRGHAAPLVRVGHYGGLRGSNAYKGYNVLLAQVYHPNLEQVIRSTRALFALVGEGAHGQRERIQTLRCQACATTFSTRRDTPLYRLKTASSRVAEVLTALAEALSVSAAVRVFGHRHATITTSLTRAGAYSATLHDRFFRRLHLPHIQSDELRSRLRKATHTLWLWLALDLHSVRQVHP
jgi:hypothetical protein